MTAFWPLKHNYRKWSLKRRWLTNFPPPPSDVWNLSVVAGDLAVILEQEDKGHFFESVKEEDGKICLFDNCVAFIPAPDAYIQIYFICEKSKVLPLFYF